MDVVSRACLSAEHDLPDHVPSGGATQPNKVPVAPELIEPSVLLLHAIPPQIFADEGW